MRNTIVYLVGYPGVGKLTVAKALCRLTGARLMDNHLINNVAFSLIDTDGVVPIPEMVWDEIRQIRDSALRIVAHHTSRERSFVLTNVLLDEPGDRSVLAQVEYTAVQRGARFVPVVLDCTAEENMKRLIAPGRTEAFKETNVETARTRREKQPLLRFDHPNRLDLNNTELSPEAAADIIIKHAESIAS